MCPKGFVETEGLNGINVLFTDYVLSTISVLRLGQETCQFLQLLKQYVSTCAKKIKENKKNKKYKKKINKTVKLKQPVTILESLRNFFFFF